MSAPWDQDQFNSVLRRYLQVCTRDLVTAINTKGYYIARGATRLTVKADKVKIKSQLFKLVTLHRKDGSTDIGPLLAGLVNKRRGAKEEKGLFGRPMAKEMLAVMRARNRSVAFLKSGWLPSIRKLGPLSDRRGAPPMDRSARQYGRDRGGAVPAKEASEIVTTIINSAIASRETNDALAKFGGKGLSVAFQAEAASMMQYIEKKLAKATQQANHGLS